MNRKPTLLLLLALFSLSAFAQNDWIRTGTGLGQEKPRIAVAEFKAANADATTGSLQKVFNDTLVNDLQQSGILEVISKSFYPLQQPGTPQEVNLASWSNDPAKAAMLAFGNINASTGDVAVSGWLYDVTNTQNPQVL